MAAESIRANKLGNVLKMEFASEHGYSRTSGTVNLLPTSKIGDVLANVAGVWTLVTVATTGNPLGVLIDPTVTNKRPATGNTDTAKIAVLTDISIVVLEQLNFGADVTSPAEKSAVVASLEATNIKVRSQV